MKRIVELGCGRDKSEGFLGVDKRETEEVDKVIDLDKSDWDLPSDYFEYVKAINLFEHLENPVNFMEEVYRILKDDGRVLIQAPHRSSQNWTDPTHKRLTGSKTMKYYFTEDGRFSYYSDAEFEILRNRIVFPKRKVFFWNYVVEPLVNLNFFTRMIYEKSFLSKIFPAENMVFELRK